MDTTQTVNERHDVAGRLADLFPDTDRVQRRRRRRRTRVTAATVLTVALVGVGVAVADASGSEALQVRTSTARVRDVDTVLTGVATAESVAQAAVSFTTSGTVDAVSVAVGDQVVVGQHLASLDTTSLERDLHTKQAALATAELTLANALDSPSTTSASSGAASSNSASSGATPETAVASTTPTSTADTDARRAAQQAVVDAQHNVDAALTAADAELAAVGTACDTSSAPASDGSTTTTAPADGGSTTTTAPATVTTASDLCRAALTRTQSAQHTVADTQRALATATSQLDELLAAQTATPTAAQPAAATTSAASSRSVSTAPTSSGAPGAASTAVTSERLVADQKAVDAAALEVIVATQAVERADIVAPLAGTVVAVGFATGDDVTAASSTQTITIASDGGIEVTTTVDVARIADVEVGQAATLVVDGSDDELDGEVVAVSATPPSSTSTSYGVTIALTDRSAAAAIPNGATGTVSIVTKAATSALAVPTSAVTATADGHTVQVVRGAKTSTVEVGVGVVGDRWTQVTSGLREGDRVVLADLEEALPGSATATSGSDQTGRTGEGGLPAGFPNGGLPSGVPSGGFTGGPP